jgi:hypothetical protein
MRLMGSREALIKIKGRLPRPAFSTTNDDCQAEDRYLNFRVRKTARRHTALRTEQAENLRVVTSNWRPLAY